MSDNPTSDVPPTDPTPEAAAPATSAVAVADPPAEAPASPPVAEVPAAAPPAAEPPIAPTPAAPAGRRKVQVPMWLLALLGVVVIAAGAFFVGRSTAPETSGPTTLADAVEQTASGEMEAGEFNVRDLIDALQQNDELNLGTIVDLLLGGLDNNR